MDEKQGDQNNNVRVNNFQNININHQFETPLVNYKKISNKIIIGIVIFALIIIISIIGFKIYKHNHKEQNNNGDVFITQQLWNDYQDGKITTDEYVRYNLYAEYDNSLLDKKYSSLQRNQVAFDTDELIDKYYNELSDDTLRYYVSKTNLDNITFELDKENENSKNDKLSMSNLFVDTVYAQNIKVTNLNKVFLSQNGNFMIWYTTTGDSATDYNTVKKLANGLEKTISEYDKIFDSKYDFNSGILSKGKTYQNQIEILKNENIDEKYLESAMQVYLVNYSDDSLAKYVRGSQNMIKFWYKIKDGDKYGSIILPYILIKPSTFENFENIEQLYNHELFHHYQHNVLCGTSNCVMGNDPYIIEATANWASALVTHKTNDKGYLNEWAGTARKYASTYMSDEFINKYGINTVGYILYVYMYNYASNASNGIQKIINSIYQDNALKYLQDNTTTEELAKIQTILSYENLLQDYSNKNLIVETEFNAPIQIKETITIEKNINDVKIHPLAIDYYLLDVNSKEQQYEIKLIRDNASINVSLIGEINGKYKLLENSSIKKENFVFNTNYYDEYDKLYIAVSNALPTLCNYYSIEISKTSYVDKKNLLNDYELDENITINGFKFKLGIKLEDFIKGTGAVIDEKDFEIAKRKSNSFAGLYNSIAAKIIYNENEINLKIFIDTSDLDNITVDGVSINSQRGIANNYSDTNENLNLVTCEFKILGRYNVDTTTLSDLDKFLKLQVKKVYNSSSDKYELKMSSKDGFGIVIWFNAYENEPNKYYMSYVNITNNVALVW